MHREIVRELGRAALDRNHRADARPVTIRAEKTGRGKRSVPSNRDVLADLGDQGTTTLIDGLARGQLQGVERLEVGRLRGQRHLGDFARERLEIGLASDEVGLAVDLGHHRGLAVGGFLERDHALGRHARGFLVSLGEPLLAHEFGGGVEITLRFDECFLALHHPGARALA